MAIKNSAKREQLPATKSHQAPILLGELQDLKTKKPLKMAIKNSAKREQLPTAAAHQAPILLGGLWDLRT
jgi:hypothetical protein